MEITDAQIEFKDFNFYYGKFHALKDINFKMARHKCTAFIGPSGCGKSTLLRIIAGFEQPSSGEALMWGMPIKGPDPTRGMVFQDYALFPWLSVRDNIGFGPASRGLARPVVKETVDKFIELVGLTKFANAYPHQLSGGMKQRVAIARVLANDAEIVLMDAGHLQEREAQNAAEGGYSKHNPPLPLYTIEDVERTLPLLTTLEFDTDYELTGHERRPEWASLPAVTVRMTRAGHILGSAFVFGLLALWPAMSGHLGPRVPWPLRRRVGVMISIVAFVLIELTLWGIILRADTDGAREVLLYAVTALWPLVVVLWTKVRGAGWAYPAVRRV